LAIFMGFHGTGNPRNSLSISVSRNPRNLIE
jgi:hypothetical protein